MSKPTDHWTEDALKDLARIWEQNPQHHDRLLVRRARLDDRLKSDPEELAVEISPDGTAIGFEPPLPLDEGMVIAIGIRFVVSERKVYQAWAYIKPELRG